MFHTSKVYPLDSNLYVYIKDIADESGMENIEDAYRKYVPNVIRYRLEQTLPYLEAFSCNTEGVIKIVHYKKFVSYIT